MTTFISIETITDDYFDVVLQSQVLKPSPKYDANTSASIKVRVELARASKKRRAETIAELMNAIKELGIAPQEYASKEPISLARMVAFLAGEGRIIHKHPLFEDLLIQHGLAIANYMPKWEAPVLLWYVINSSDSVKPVIERRITIT